MPKLCEEQRTRRPTEAKVTCSWGEKWDLRIMLAHTNPFKHCQLLLNYIVGTCPPTTIIINHFINMYQSVNVISTQNLSNFVTPRKMSAFIVGPLLFSLFLAASNSAIYCATHTDITPSFSSHTSNHLPSLPSFPHFA